MLVEPESEAIRSFMSSRSEMTSSLLSAVEVPRSADRVGDERAKARAQRLIDSIDLIDLEPGIVTAARDLDPAGLRSLDAIHVATALELGDDVEAFVSYDRRQLEAAGLAGLPVVAPGT